MFSALKEKLKSWFSRGSGKLKPQETEGVLGKEKIKKTKKIKAQAPKDEKIEEIKKQAEKSKEREEEQGIKESEKEKTKTAEEKTSFFDRFKVKLTEEKFEWIFQELETILLQSNVALEVVEKIKADLKEELLGKNLSDINLQEKLKNSLDKILVNPPDIITEIKSSLTQKQPFVILLAGINGSGKTTTLAKLAHLLKKQGFSCCVAAADTFRAASIEQLQKHADALKIHMIKKDYGADPASVGFDAIAYAKKHHTDIVLIDTAGRMNTKDSLMKEIDKICRVNRPNMRIFVGESITGNDAIEQAKAFDNAINLTGIILAKADVDEKGGTALSVSYVTRKPILFLGTGQEMDDLEVFDKEKLIRGLGL